jgi:hypothetical protein
VLWKRDTLSDGDLFAKRTITYGGEPGAYAANSPSEVHRYKRIETRYETGQQYGMEHNEIHSIFFERNTLVLFFEGPSVTEETFVLEPWCRTTADAFMVVPTFEVRPWMFQREAGAAA